MKATKFSVLLAVVLVAFLLSGCYINEQVNADQIGVQMSGGAIRNIVGPGVYTDLGFFSDLRQIEVDAVTFTVEDPEVLTKDNQPIAEKITIQARRNSNTDDVKNLMTNWANLVKDDYLIQTVSATAREGMKNGTRLFTLTQLLDDRNGLANEILKELQEDSQKYSVTIINVTIENIGADPAYIDQLKQKALYTAQTDAELKRQELIRQQAANQKLEQEQQTSVLQAQLDREKAQTNVNLEIASRAGKMTAAQYEVYKNNIQAYELERLTRLKEILGDKSVFYFLPEGTDLTMLLSQTGSPTVVPVPTTP